MGRTRGRCWRSRCLIGLLISAVGMFWPIDAEAQISKLPHEGMPGDFFGASVAIDDSLAIVGAPSQNACGENSGAAYIFRRDASSGVWQLLASVPNPNCEPGLLFGRSVAISGNIAVIAAGGESFAGDRSAAAYVIQLSADGRIERESRLTPAPGEVDGLFASQVAIHGPRILVMSSGDRARGKFQGMAHVYEQSSNGDWGVTSRIQPARFHASTAFGGRGAIHGDHVIITAPSVRAAGSGSIYVFEYDHTGDVWLQRTRLDGFSQADLAVDISFTHAVIGDHGSSRGQGRAVLLEREAGGAWVRKQELRPSVTTQSGALGTSVAIRGERALVVGYDEQLDVAHNIDRVVFVFEPDGRRQWNQRHVVDIGEVYFGSSVGFDGRDAIVGLAGDGLPGAAYVVRIH